MPEWRAGPALGEALESLARAMRGSVGSLRAAAETLEAFPAMGEVRRRRLLTVVAEEAERLGRLAEQLEQLASGSGPRGSGAGESESVRVDELVAAVGGTARELGIEVEVAEPAAGLREANEPSVPVEVTLKPLLVAVSAFLGELRRELAVHRIRLRTEAVGDHLLLDVAWAPEPGDLGRLVDWQAGMLDEVLAGGGDPGAPAIVYPGLRRVAREHRGEAWFNLDRDGGAAHLRVLLPLAMAAAASSPGGG